MFEIGEKVELMGNPLDEQLNQFIPLGTKTIIDVKDVKDIPHTSGQWVKISEHNDWLDSTWFKKSNQRTFYRLLTPSSFADLDYNTLDEAKSKLIEFGGTPGSEYYDYWQEKMKECKIVKVTETIEDIE
jgi:hypothetical protein